MKQDRRNILKAGMLGGVTVASGLPSWSLQAASPANKPLSILVLGGTGFIGPHMVREALRRGHAVTLFNRGKTNNELFPDLETINGDRGGDLDGLKHGHWDAVIDNSGYVPRHVENSTRTLASSVGYYLYISTVSVYADFTRANDESSPLASIDDEHIEEVTGETYGPLKALCERRAAAEIDPDRLSIIRPTYICGPGDHTDRFTYYPVRTARGGRMAWPGSPAHGMQIIDVRDLAGFTIDCIERRTAGIFNAVNPPGAYTFADLLEDSQVVSATTVDPVWLDDAFITAAGARDAFPIYAPGSGPDSMQFGFSEKRALAAGLRNRPPRETVRDLLAWWASLPEQRVANARFAMTPEREADLLRQWDAQSSH